MTSALMASCAQIQITTMPQQSAACSAKLIDQLPDQGCVQTKGHIAKVYDADEFVLAEETGKVEVFTNHADLPIYRDERLTVKGHTDYSKWKRIIGIRKEIYATQVTLQNGTRVDIQQPHKPPQ